jgi:hypothetical protein
LQVTERYKGHMVEFFTAVSEMDGAKVARELLKFRVDNVMNVSRVAEIRLDPQNTPYFSRIYRAKLAVYTDGVVES